MTNPPAIVADSSRPALIGQLRHVWSALADLGGELSDEEWASPTPCPGWSVAAQYAHVVGTESMLLGRPNPEVPTPAETPAHVRNRIAETNEVWVDALAATPRREVLAQLAEVTGERLKALEAMTDADFDAPSWTPVGQADYRRFMQIRVFDCWVHEQDVRDATGRPGGETGPVAEQAVDELVRAAGFVVGKKAGATPGEGVRLVLGGPLSRRIDVEVGERARVVEALADPPTVTVELTSTAYCRLSCGRVAPSDVLAGALGGVRLSGDEALGRRVVENLAFTI
ncbi:MAG: maleylpyruvate isomerase family mycothiol-dependent enzyme [Acidobacteriota bacterium]|nr:maleylpyruvate isomerase family mycothiol-dependent enzyme [Acidobacteriota bacterium]